ncbi:hypothetical protein TRFO_25688 [Tritrichomonas foetus]|uniref:F5/8 type C domain-containing protein n=1 Tax=Tritrichomonas foetus TaxID=1144522 RepID=A0A1J4K4A7_9EUKA|nr:hypothetical protein TRFO_25688 [Tritrichomonas foetus]|eukprot:OHT06281.1 hypothetical protein TRFO_25688 [Tritrichomonas foetus]
MFVVYILAIRLFSRQSKQDSKTIIVDEIGMKSNSFTNLTNNQKPALHSIDVLDGLEKIANRSRWNITASSYQANNRDGEGSPLYMIDGNASTIWHSRYDNTPGGQGNVSQRPFSLLIDLNETVRMGGFMYGPRLTGQNGRFQDYCLYTGMSRDEVVLNMVAQNCTKYGNFTYENISRPENQHVRLEDGVDCRFIAITTNGTEQGPDNGKYYTAVCSELEVYVYPKNETESPTESEAYSEMESETEESNINSEKITQTENDNEGQESTQSSNEQNNSDAIQSTNEKDNDQSQPDIQNPTSLETKNVTSTTGDEINPRTDETKELTSNMPDNPTKVINFTESDLVVESNIDSEDSKNVKNNVTTAGIAIGVIILLIVIALLTIYLIYRRNLRLRETSDNDFSVELDDGSLSMVETRTNTLETFITNQSDFVENSFMKDDLNESNIVLSIHDNSDSNNEADSHAFEINDE